MQFSLLHLAEIGDEKLFCVAFASRALVALYMLLADLLITDYDSSAELYALKFSALRSVSHWDAVHFRHIARFGYSHEQLHAFFPAMPLVIRFFEFTGVAEIGVALFVASCYSLACVCLRHLTRRVLQPESYECLRLAVRSDDSAKFVSTNRAALPHLACHGLHCGVLHRKSVCAAEHGRDAAYLATSLHRGGHDICSGDVLSLERHCSYWVLCPPRALCTKQRSPLAYSASSLQSCRMHSRAIGHSNHSVRLTTIDVLRRAHAAFWGSMAWCS